LGAGPEKLRTRYRRADPATAMPKEPTARIEFPDEDVTTKDVRQRRFVVRRGTREIPGLLWTPADASGPRPLVLICHGAGNTKREQYIVSLARRLVRHQGFAAAAIDGPVHGDRRADGSKDGATMFIEFAQLWAEDPQMTDEMVADWRATLDALEELDEVGREAVGWWGLSMGTILGIPVVAAEKRIVAAVLGLMGTRAPREDYRKRIIADAKQITCPVLFLMQWDDELMRRDDVLELFGEIASSDKRFHANPGGHVEVPGEEIEATERLFARHLLHGG